MCAGTNTNTRISTSKHKHKHTPKHNLKHTPKHRHTHVGTSTRAALEEHERIAREVPVQEEQGHAGAGTREEHEHDETPDE